MPEYISDEARKIANEMLPWLESRGHDPEEVAAVDALAFDIQVALDKEYNKALDDAEMDAWAHEEAIRTLKRAIEKEVT